MNVKEINMINVQSITQTFKGVLDNSLRKPANIISSIILLCSIAKRPGLSCMISTSKILQKLASDGIPTGQLPDGSPNLMNLLVNNVVCEIYRAMKEDANIQVTLNPNSLTTNGSGGNAGGPVNVVSTNTNGGSGVGILQ